MLLGISPALKAAVITWTGTSGGNWNTASNWTPNMVPGANDDVIFNTSVTVNMDILSAVIYTINSLKITATSNVTLLRTQAGGGDRILQVKSTDAVTMGLEIDAGCILLIHGINTNTTGNLDYILDFGSAAGVTGEIFGELHFSGVGSGGMGDRVRLRVFTDAANNGNVAVKSGGLIKYLDLTGNTTSAAGAYLTMENGSTYEIAKNGGSFPEGTWLPASLAKVNNISGVNGPQFLGTAYGNLEWNCPAQTAIAFLNANVSFNNVLFISTNNTAFRVKTGASAGVNTMTINGNLSIGPNCLIETTGNTVTATNGGRINLKGNLLNQGTLTTLGVVNTINEIELNGTTNQLITNNGSVSGVRLLFSMNNAAGATLNTPLTLPYNLALTNGKITTTATNLLIMIDNAIYTGGSINSFVEGPLRKTGDDAFVFPVGVGSIYAPIGLSGGTGSAVTNEFTAEYKRVNPQSVYGTSYTAGIDHISYVEYWTLERGVSTAASKIITLDVHPTSFCKEIAETFVSRWNGTQWTNEISSSIFAGTVGPYEIGSVFTNSAVTDFTPSPAVFTLGTDRPFVNNPLPIKLISFDVKRRDNNTAVLDWILAECCSGNARFEVEKSAEGQLFHAVYSVPGSEVSRFYTFYDNQLTGGVTYYRLKMTDADGKTAYSRTVAVWNGAKGLRLTSMIPTLVTHSAQLTITASQPVTIDLLIIDMKGSVVYKQRQSLPSGNTSVGLALYKLAAGAYQILAVSATGERTPEIRFLKQ
jgi:hypothetical protein